MDRVVTFQCLQLRLRRNVSHAKINLAFGAGHVTMEPIYFTLLTVSLSFSNSLTRSHSFRHSYPPQMTIARENLIADKEPKIGKHIASENMFRARLKLVYLSSFKLLNFSWNLTLPTNIIHTFSQRTDTHLAAICFFSFPAYTHTYTHICKYDFTILSLFSYLNSEHMYTQTCSKNTQYLSSYRNSIIHIDTDTQIPNKHIQYIATLY